jgi:uncharacterized protein (TIGR03437 family)
MPISYRWYKNGVPVPDATDWIYTSPPVTNADDGAIYKATATNSVGTVTSPVAGLTVEAPAASNGDFGFFPIYPGPLGNNCCAGNLAYGASPDDIVAAQYKFLVAANESQTIKIIFGLASLNTPGSGIYYEAESNIYSDATVYTDGGCTTWPLLGKTIERQASLRTATADYPFAAGQQSLVASAIKTSDPINWPIQTYLIDGLPSLWKSDSISQFPIDGLQGQVTIARGDALTDVSGFQRCGIPMLATTYRLWTITTEIAGHNTVINQIVVPDVNAGYFNSYPPLQFNSEFEKNPGLFTVQYWDFMYRRESDSSWVPVSRFKTQGGYDGDGQDCGVHVVTVNGQDRVEFNNAAGLSYFPANLFFSIAPPTCTYTISASSLLFPARGGADQISIGTSCSWNITELPDWVQSSATRGNGAATVSLAIAPNASAATQTATISVAGVPLTIIQGGTQVNTSPTTLGDLGPGATFSTTNGWCVTGATSPNCGGEVTRYIAASFVPTTTFTLSNISVPVGYNSGTNGAIINLMSSSYGVPGTVLESWTVSNLPSGPALTAVTSKLNPTLQAGQTYWVEVEPLASDTLIFWYTNSLNISGGMTNIGGGGWNTLPGASSMPAYSVTGLNFQVTQTIAFAPLNNVSVGSAPFALTATASSGLAVTFTSTTASVCTVSDGTVTVVAAGTCSIAASQAGNANYTAATPVTQSFTVARAPAPPTLTEGTLANGATYIAGGLVPGSWAQVKGTNLGTTTRIWAASDFTGLGNSLPTNLSGVQVNVNNQAAAVYYISPTQVSFQVPSGIEGTASVEVIANGVVSDSVTGAAATNSPGIFPITLGGTNYAAAVLLDGKIAADPSKGPAFRNAVPGDLVQLYATGLVPSPTGTLISTTLFSGVTVTIGNVTIPADAAALVAVGEFQINFTVPQSFASMPPGLYTISISINGITSPASINSSPPGPVVIPIGH